MPTSGIEVSGIVDSLRREDGVPIEVVEHALWHRHRAGRDPSSTARVKLNICGEQFSMGGVHGDGPIHTLDDAFRKALALRFGEQIVDCVQASGFRMGAEEHGAQMGMRAHAVVTVSFVAGVNKKGDLVSVASANPMNGVPKESRLHSHWVPWCARAVSQDTIDATVHALSDGYNYFVMQFLHQSHGLQQVHL